MGNVKDSVKARDVSVLPQLFWYLFFKFSNDCSSRVLMGVRKFVWKSILVKNQAEESNGIVCFFKVIFYYTIRNLKIPRRATQDAQVVFPPIARRMGMIHVSAPIPHLKS